MNLELSGAQLEADFASWLKEEQAYRGTELRKRISPSGGHAYEVDVYATKRGPRSLRTARVGAVVYLAIMLVVFLGIHEVEQALQQSVAVILAPEYAPYAVFIFLGLGALCYVYGMKWMETRAFVECKEHKRKVDRQVIDQTVGRMNTLGDAERRENGREEWIVVAASGFSGPALEAAEVHGIKCYSREGKGFRLESSST